MRVACRGLAGASFWPHAACLSMRGLLSLFIVLLRKHKTISRHSFGVSRWWISLDIGYVVYLFPTNIFSHLCLLIFLFFIRKKKNRLTYFYSLYYYYLYIIHVLFTLVIYWDQAIAFPFICLCNSLQQIFFSWKKGIDCTSPCSIDKSYHKGLNFRQTSLEMHEWRNSGPR